MQVAELCENTRRGARGLIVALATSIGSPNEHELLKRTGERLAELHLRPKQLALDEASPPAQSSSTCHHPTERSSPAANWPSPRRPTAGWRSCASAPSISHLKRRYGLRRSRLKGHSRTRTWASWAILAYNLDTIAIRHA
jgi:hypothetical protein